MDIDKSRYLAINWFEEFLKFFNEDLLKETAVDDPGEEDAFFFGSNNQNYLFDENDSKSKNEEEKVRIQIEEEVKDPNKVQEDLMNRLRFSLFPDMLQCILYYINTENTDLVMKLNKINTQLQRLVMKVLKNNDDLEPITICLKKNFMRGKVKTKEIAIEWLTELFKHYSDKLLNKDDEILSNIIQSINFKESKLTESVLRLLCLMSSKYHQFLKEIIQMLLQRFKKDKDIPMESINNLFHIM